MQFSVGEQLSGTPYRFVEAVGSGGMGSVYEVEHAELGKRFVLKILHDHLAARSDLVARMRNEWRALAKLNHPNIVQVTDAGQLPNGLPFYVMEKLEGCNLGQLIGKEGRIPPERAGALIVDVLDGLNAAHSTGAVHRDVKPQNIFVVGGGRAKLLDFGIAKLRDRAARVVTAGGVSIGTPRYMAPEQAEGRAVDGRADIYAAGLVLYECIAGKGPFAHIRDPNELVLAHIGMDPLRLDMVVAGLSPEWADLVQHWLSKLPSDRPANAGIAAAELRALIKASPGAVGALEDITRGGIYDAETVGADEIGDGSKAPDGRWTAAIRRRVNQGEARPTRDVSAAADRALAPNLHEAKKTLGWGTLHDEEPEHAALTATQSLSPERASSVSAGAGLRAEQNAKNAPRSERSRAVPPRFETPPPVSSRQVRIKEQVWWNRLSPTSKSVVTVLGAAVGSFVLAWVGLQVVSRIKADINRATDTDPAEIAAKEESSSISASNDGSNAADELNAQRANDEPAAALQPGANTQVEQHDAAAHAPSRTPEQKAAVPKASASPQAANSLGNSKNQAGSTTQAGDSSSKKPNSDTVPPKTAPTRSATSPEKNGTNTKKSSEPSVHKAPAPSPTLPGSGLW